MSNYTPVEYLTKIQKLKYKAAFFPILLVVLSFVINLIFKLDHLKYFAIIGLIWYIFTIIRFRVRKNYPPESETEILLSPIYGKITKISKNSVTIKKGLYQAVDIRYTGQGNEVKIISKNVNYFENEPTLAGKLIGIVSASAVCVCEISEDWKIEVSLGDKVVSGETILAVKI